MAGRPPKQNVDYFPHYCKHGGTILVLERKYGIQGSGAWWKLLENLGRTPGHSIDCNDITKWILLQSETYFQENDLIEYLNLLADLKAIDQELWTKSKIIWCQNFVDNISGVYVERRKEIPQRPNNNHKTISPPDNSIIQGNNTHIKLNEIKLNNTTPKGDEKSSSDNSYDGFRKSLLSPDSKNKIAVLVAAFKEWHKDAPPEDLEKIYDRMGVILKRNSNDYGLTLKFIWESVSKVPQGSHINYIDKMVTNNTKTTFNKLIGQPKPERKLKTVAEFRAEQGL